MDGLLIDSEDIYTLCNNIILRQYGKPSLPWNIKAQLQGRPGPEVRSCGYAFQIGVSSYFLNWHPQLFRPVTYFMLGHSSPFLALNTRISKVFCNANTFPRQNLCRV